MYQLKMHRGPICDMKKMKRRVERQNKPEPHASQSRFLGCFTRSSFYALIIAIWFVKATG